MARNARQMHLADDILSKVTRIKRQHPHLSGQVDALEDELRTLLRQIKDELAVVPVERDRKLLTLYLINLVHKAQDEILAD